MFKLKKLIISLLIICVFSSTSFAFLPAVLTGLTLAQALQGSVILHTIAAGIAYYIAQPTATSKLSASDQTLKLNSSAVWVDLTDPVNPLIKSAPVTVDLPVTAVKNTVLNNKSSYPKLYEKLFSEAVQVSNDTYVHNGVTYNASSTMTNSSYPNGTSPSYSPTVQLLNGKLYVVQSQTVVAAVPERVPYEYIIHYTLAITWKIFDPAPTIVTEKPLSTDIAMDSTYSAEVDNVIIANNSLAQGMDGSVPVSASDLEGAPVASTDLSPSSSTAEMTNAIKDAFGLSNAVPDGGFYDTDFLKPELKSLSTLLSTIFSNSPLAGMVRTFTINTSGASSVVPVGQVYGKDFNFDFSRWQSFFVSCGSILMVIVHGFAILIVMRGWKNG